MIEILIGILSGTISGTGMGGGTILILLLVYMLGIDQHIAQATHLVFFIPTYIIAIIINLKNKNIALQTAIFVSVFGILGAIIGANISIKIDVNILKKCFGIFLLIIAIHEIYTIVKWYKKEKIRDTKKKQS